MTGLPCLIRHISEKNTVVLNDGNRLPCPIRRTSRGWTGGCFVEREWIDCRGQERRFWGFAAFRAAGSLSTHLVNLQNAVCVPLRDPGIENRLKERPAPVALLDDLGSFRLLKIERTALPAGESRPALVNGDVEARRVMGAPHLPGWAAVVMNDGRCGGAGQEGAVAPILDLAGMNFDVVLSAFCRRITKLQSLIR